MPDMVNHPQHYNMGQHEVIDVIWNWQLSFCLGNAMKYIGRAGYKGNIIQDLEKAIFYLDYERSKVDPERTSSLNTKFGELLPVQEVINDWKLGRRCGDALRSIFAAAHGNFPHGPNKGDPYSYLGLAAANLAAKIIEERNGNSET